MTIQQKDAPSRITFVEEEARGARIKVVGVGGGGGNVLTVAVVTLPFSLEGKRRMAQAMDGLAQLRECVDSVIAIPNDRLLQTVARHTPVSEAFRVADDVLRQAVQGI